MSSKLTGDPRAFRYGIEYEFDPTTGDQTTESWRGTRPAIVSLARAFARNGYRVRTSNSGPVWEMQLRYGREVSQAVEVPIDTYGFDTEEAQVSIFAFPTAVEEANRDGNPANYRRLIEDAVKNGTPNPYNNDLANFPFSQVLHIDLSRGIEAYPIRRLVLSRNRTYSIGYGIRTGATETMKRVVLNASPVVYTTTALVRDFAIPKVIADQLPPNPPAEQTPVGTQWAWYLRGDSSRVIPALAKVEEQRQWVFAAWTAPYYTVVT